MLASQGEEIMTICRNCYDEHQPSAHLFGDVMPLYRAWK